MEISGEYRFDGWIFRERSDELLKGRSRIHLQSQAHVVLKELLLQPGELVTREELIARLWPHGVVDYETGLNSVVRRLRAALGDSADAPRYIETIPKRGYRFIGRLEEPVVSIGTVPTPATALRSRPQPWVAAAVLLGTVGAVVMLSSLPLDPGDGRGANVATNRQAQILELREWIPADDQVAVRLADLAILDRRYAEALNLAHEMTREPDRLLARTLAYHGLGRKAESDAALEALLASMDEDQVFRIVEALAFRGQRELAFHWLQASGGDREDPWIRYSPFVKTLQKDPRWAAWMDAARNHTSVPVAMRRKG